MVLKGSLVQWLMVMLLLNCCNSKNHLVEETQTTPVDSIKVIVFKVDDGYGYEIYVHHKKLIYQPYIATVEGNVTFPHQEQAEQTAQLVSSKIRQGIIPPALTVEEIDTILKQQY